MLPELHTAESNVSICDTISKTKIEKTLNCKICNIEFTQIKDLKRHVYSHITKNSSKCNICGKELRDNPALKRHLNRHTEGRSFQCHICQKILSEKGNLVKHLKLHTHEPELFECYTCGMKIKSKRDLTRHFMVHTGEKPFKCSICSKRFGSQNTLNKHTRTHTGEKPFKCNICDKKISRRYLLNDHLKLHTGEKTTNDDGTDVPRMMSLGRKAFPSNTKIKNHVLRHTNNKKYECNICSQAFFTRAELNRHLTHIQHAYNHSGDNVKGLVTRELKVYLGEKISLSEHVLALARENSKIDIDSKKTNDGSPCISPLRVLLGEKLSSFGHGRVCGNKVPTKSNSTQSEIRTFDVEEMRFATSNMKQQLKNELVEAVENSSFRKEPNKTTVHSSQHLRVRSSQKFKPVEHTTHSKHSRENSNQKNSPNQPCGKPDSADAYVNVNTRKSLKSEVTCVKKFKEYCLSNYPSSVHTSQKPFESDIHNIDIEKPPKVRTSETSFDCFTCHGKFDEEINLIRHLRLHTSEKPSYIGKEGASTRQLNNDSGDKPFKCYTCHKTFDQQVRLTQHLRMHVSGEEISCGICNIQLKHKNDLPAHLLVHTTEISNCGNDPLTLAGGYSVTDIVTNECKVEVEDNDVYYSGV